VRRVLYDSLVGIVGFFAPGSNEQLRKAVTIIEAVETGWWYSASLPDSRLVIAYMTDADLYARGGRHSAVKWLEQLSRTVHTWARAEGRLLVSQPLVFQAASSRLDRVHGDNWLAVGDAAIAFDPISGQGVYRALESGIRAGDAVKAFLEGEPREVVRYADRVGEIFNQFLLQRAKYYGQEERWTNCSFWQRRQKDLANALVEV